MIISAGPAFATGDITGTVTAGLGQGIEGICVEAYDSKTERDLSGSDLTNDEGVYTIPALDDGDYKLYFYDPDNDANC